MTVPKRKPEQQLVHLGHLRDRSVPSDHNLKLPNLCGFCGAIASTSSASLTLSRRISRAVSGARPPVCINEYPLVSPSGHSLPCNHHAWSVILCSGSWDSSIRTLTLTWLCSKSQGRGSKYQYLKTPSVTQHIELVIKGIAPYALHDKE